MEFINQPNVILMQTSIMYDRRGDKYNNDYVTARIGVELLFSHDYQLTEHMPVAQISGRTVFMKQLWTPLRDAGQVASDIVQCYHDLQQQNPTSVIAYITPGSPDLYNTVYDNLKKLNILGTVVNTRSSAELAVDYLVSNGMITHGRLNIVAGNQPDIKSHDINILGCLGNIYNVDMKILLPALIARISNGAKIFRVSLSDQVHVESLAKIQLIQQLMANRSSFNSTLIVIAN